MSHCPLPPSVESRQERKPSSLSRPPAPTTQARPDWSTYCFTVETFDPVTDWACRQGPPARPLFPQHGPDFRSVVWPINGELVRFGPFTALQAAVIRVLWEAWENGTPDVGGDYLLEQAGSDREARRIDAIFVNTEYGGPAWGGLIVSVGKGSYRLADPS